MMMLKNMSSFFKLEQLKKEKLFYEMLTATVSHEMKTPLNSIINLVSELDNFTSREGKKFLTIVKNQTKFMLSLINDMIDYV